MNEFSLGTMLPLWSILPFVGILLSIALLPLFAPHFWHKRFHLVSFFWALFFAIPFIIKFREVALHEILHIYLVDYIPFIILLWGLYTISGGIVLRGSLTGTPLVNTIILLIGTLLSSFIGTTGASMVLIKPILKANKYRKTKQHIVVFFIFLVSNIGGSLTPLGDPPLFLGFLHNVPFFWTFSLLPHFLITSMIVLIIFYILDNYYYKKEKYTINKDVKYSLSIAGLNNLLFLFGIIGAILFSGFFKLQEISFLGIHLELQSLLRDILIIVMGILALKFTKDELRKENQFTWEPIKEVAYLFFGIFMTMIPALAILKAGENGSLGFFINRLQTPSHYFWVTGILSSFLDNAPTYLTFFSSLLGKFYANLPEQNQVALLISEKAIYLKAISIGAVFMGAISYIGNAPNFMVKSIAKEWGVKMPSFFGYMFKYSIPILIPIFILVTFIFF